MKLAGGGDDDAGQIFREHFNISSRTLDFKGRKLAAFPLPPTKLHAPPIEPKEVDASNNALTALPLRAMSDWAWPSCLTRLRLVRNQVAAIDWVSEGFVLPSLEELDLSSNRLTSTIPSAGGQRVPLLAAIAGIAPSLSVLDLSLNQLNTDQGINDLVAPGLTAESISDRSAGVTVLRLQNNQIEALDELAAVATALSQGGGGVCAYRGWQCEELVLSDNNIAKVRHSVEVSAFWILTQARQLPPALGLLPPPLQLLAVGGNPFRIPNRRVYEGAGGTKSLLTWLKDRM